MLLDFNKKKFGAIGRNTKIFARMKYFSYAEHIYLSDYVSIGPDCWLYATPESRIEVHKGSIIAPRCKIYTRNHRYDGKGLSAIPYDEVNLVADVIIHEGCWIGESVIILPGVSIGRGAVVGAGSVVTKCVPDYAVVAGNPAKIVSYRDAERFEELFSRESYILKNNPAKIFKGDRRKNVSASNKYY